MSREVRLVKNTLILSIGNLLPSIAALVVLPIYTSMLSKAEYGMYDLINIISYIMTVVITLQIHQAAFRFLIGKKDSKTKEEVISNTILLVIPLAVIASSVACLYLRSVESILVRITISIYIFMIIMLSVIGQITRGLGENKIYSIGSIIQSFLNMAFIVLFLLLLNTGIIGLFISLDIAILIALLYMLVYTGIPKYIKFRSLKKSMILNMLAYSWPMVPNTISIWIINTVNRLIILVNLGIEMSAVYSVANKIPALFNMAYGAFNMAWQESASIASEDKESEKYYSDIFENLFGFLIGIMALLIAVTPILFVLLIRGDYEKAYYQMPLLFIGMLFSSLSSYFGSIYIALKKTKTVGVSSIIGAVISITLNIALVKEIGLYASSISTIVSFLILTLYRSYDIRKFRSIHYNRRRIFLGITLLIIMCVFCYQRNMICNVLNTIIAVIIVVIYNIKLLKFCLLRFLARLSSKGV